MPDQVRLPSPLPLRPLPVRFPFAPVRPPCLTLGLLRSTPCQIYVSVRDVRTADDANLVVHLMIFYELHSIETMLDQTNDLIGDIVNAVSADVMTFASRQT